MKNKKCLVGNGDRCSKFFHKMVNDKVKHNKISSLSIIGALCEDKTKIKNHIIDYYECLYTENVIGRYRHGGHELPKLEANKSSLVKRSFTDSEIWILYIVWKVTKH